MKPHLQTVYDFIIDFQKKHGVSPNSQEIAVGLGYASHHTMAAYIRELEKIGKIRRHGSGRAKRIIIERSTFCHA